MKPETHAGQPYRWDPPWRRLPIRYRRFLRRRSHKADRRYAKAQERER